MRKLMLLMSAMLMSVSATGSLSAAVVEDISTLDRNGNGVYEPGEVDPNCEYQSGRCYCYCPTTRFVPQYYCTTRCVQEAYTVPKKCCRMVPEYYEKQHCRHVPQYYCKTYCKMEPKYYCQMVPKYYQKQHCRYIPEQYTTTHCRQRPEYYCVEETRYRTRQIKEPHCYYQPYTYVKQYCCDTPCGNEPSNCNEGCCAQAPAPQGCCGPQGCGAR